MYANVLATSRKPPRVLFDHGLTAVEPRAPRTWTNEFCGKCHKREYQQWKGSRHAIAGRNKNFELEFLNPEHGRSGFCLNCHTPLNPHASKYSTAEPAGLDDAFARQASWVVQGVDCLTCHVREGAVLATNVTSKGQQAHPMQLAPELASAEFCAGCHQFGFKADDFPDAFQGGELQQASFEEFLEVRARGYGESRCHECHLPDGDHRMPGGYDDAMLEQAVDLTLSARWQVETESVLVSVVVEGGHVGHRIPGGEFFRFLTLQTKITDNVGPIKPRRPSDGVTPPIELSQGDSRVQVLRSLPQIERMQRSVVSQVDTRLWPGEERRFDYLVPIDRDSIDGPLRINAEIWYHVMQDVKAHEVGRTVDNVKRKVRQAEFVLQLSAPQ